MAVYQVAITGGGLAGQIAALSFARQGFETVLIAPAESRTDGRTTALMDRSLAFLQSLGLWDLVKPHATALQTMQIVDATDRLLRAPTVAFRASEIDLEAFGYNIPNAALLSILAEEIALWPNLTVRATSVEHADLGGAEAELTLATGETVLADLVVAADGRNSLIRQTAGITVHKHSYNQTAVVLNFAHDRPHRNISTEFHTRTGPFTQVPLSGNRSSLVWVVRPEEAETLLATPTEILNRSIETRMHSMLGKVTIDGGLQAWPLSAMTANQFGKGNIVLVGEAGHVFPPIGAQGLNLSLRDVEQATELAVTAKKAGLPLTIGDGYDRKRRADVLSRTAGIDLLNRSLLSSFLPVQLLRATGLHVLASIAPLRHMAMREGISPGQAFQGLRTGLGKKIDRKSA